MPPSQENLQAVWRWVQELTAQGSTNTQAALTAAMSVPGAQAVYLLTDGRPDQDCETLLAAVQRLPSIPVHTISFNCADSRANVFLSKLANLTGGRWGYSLAKCVSFPLPSSSPHPQVPLLLRGRVGSGRPSHPPGLPGSLADATASLASVLYYCLQSEDVKQLESEVAMATEQLCRAAHLLTACQEAEGRKGGAARSASVKGIDCSCCTPLPPSLIPSGIALSRSFSGSSAAPSTSQQEELTVSPTPLLHAAWLGTVVHMCWQTRIA